MHFFFLASSIIFFAWLAYQLRKRKKIEAEQQKSFWDLENEANSTRRKSLDDLDYIRIPFEELPLNALPEDERIKEYCETLKTLSENPIVNLSCISNTELKLRYGAPNIVILSRYDSAYTVLARTLQRWAEALNQAGLYNEARQVLEFAMKTKTDVSGSFTLLAEIYKKLETPEKIGDLINAAEALPSSLSKRIVRHLKE